jgi:archaellin
MRNELAAIGLGFLIVFIFLICVAAYWTDKR